MIKPWNPDDGEYPFLEFTGLARQDLSRLMGGDLD
jgi:hypothetical protein